MIDTLSILVSKKRESHRDFAPQPTTAMTWAGTTRPDGLAEALALGKVEAAELARSRAIT